jgi:hypothetical protein
MNHLVKNGKRTKIKISTSKGVDDPSTKQR